MNGFETARRVISLRPTAVNILPTEAAACIVLDAQTQNGDEPVGEYSFSGQSCLSSEDS